MVNDMIELLRTLDEPALFVVSWCLGLIIIILFICVARWIASFLP